MNSSSPRPRHGALPGRPAAPPSRPFTPESPDHSFVHESHSEHLTNDQGESAPPGREPGALSRTGHRGTRPRQQAHRQGAGGHNAGVNEDQQRYWRNLWSSGSSAHLKLSKTARI